MVLAIFLAITTASSTAHAAESPVWASNNWFNVTGATRLSVDFKINRGQSGYHYYSLAPFFDGANYGLYTGIQTTTNGPLYIFSVWNAKTAYPQNGAYSVAFTGEGEGYSLRKQYPWKLNTTYTVTLKREGFDRANNGWRWSSTIIDRSTGASLKLGEIPAPAGIATMRGGSVFHERYGGVVPVCGTTSNLEQASMTATNLSSDKPARFYDAPAYKTTFGTSNCSRFIHAFNDSSKAVTGFGISRSEFDAILNPPTKPPTQSPAAPPTPPPAAPPAPPSVTPPAATGSTLGQQTAAAQTSLPKELPATGSTLPTLAQAGLVLSIGLLMTLIGLAMYVYKNPFTVLKFPKLAGYLGLAVRAQHK